jgi:hypothetical protein
LSGSYARVSRCDDGGKETLEVDRRKMSGIFCSDLWGDDVQFGVLSFAIVVTSVLLPRLARLNACLPNQSLGIGEGQPIGIEYHNQEFQGSSQDLDLMDSKSKFRHIRVEALFFEKPFPFGPHCSYFTASIF